MIIIDSSLQEYNSLINEALLFEERGFAPNLENHADNIIEQISNTLKLDMSIGYLNDYSFKVPYLLENQTITVEGIISIDKSAEGEIIQNSAYYPKKHVITLDISNLITNNVKEWIQTNLQFKTSLIHELKHAYQHAKLNANKEHLLSYKDEKLYNKNVQNQQNFKNNIARKIAYLIYCTFPSEITAMQESAYLEIKEKCNHSFDIKKTISETVLFDNVSDIDKMLDFLANTSDANKEIIESFLVKNYNRNIDWLIKRLQKGNKLIQRSLKRIEQQIRADLEIRENALINFKRLI